MSELDDAIREHLELKRLRGADPGEVARLEQEALGAPARSIALAPQYEHELHANELPEHDAVPQFTLHTNLAAISVSTMRSCGPTSRPTTPAAPATNIRRAGP